MIKTHLLLLAIATIFLSSCGFHTPNKDVSINATIIANQNSELANALQKRFNPQLERQFTVTIENEVQKQHNASYNTDGSVSRYTLNLSAQIKVLGAKQKILLTQKFSANTALNKITSTQADRLQIDQANKRLRATLVKKILRRLQSLK